MKQFLFVAVLLAGGAAAAQPARRPAPASRPAAPPSAPLAAVFERYSDRTNQLFPLAATAQGDHRFDDQLPNDQTQARRDTLKRFYTRYLGALRTFDRARLSANDQVSYDILAYELEQRLAGYQFNNWMIPFNQFYALPSSLAQLGAGTGAQPFATVADYDHWLGRLRGFPVWADSAIGNFRRGMKAGVVLPKALVPKMVSQLRGDRQGPADAFV
jgi:uncharacterized protein (DUF885 family)